MEELSNEGVHLGGRSMFPSGTPRQLEGVDQVIGSHRANEPEVDEVDRLRCPLRSGGFLCLHKPGDFNISGKHFRYILCGRAPAKAIVVSYWRQTRPRSPKN